MCSIIRASIRTDLVSRWSVSWYGNGGGGLTSGVADINDDFTPSGELQITGGRFYRGLHQWTDIRARDGNAVGRRQHI